MAEHDVGYELSRDETNQLGLATGTSARGR